MKPLATALFSTVLALSAFAQAPAGDPPVKPPDPIPAPPGTNWANGYGAAATAAQAKGGYVLIFVTLDPTPAGNDAPHTSRLMTNFFNLMPVANKLNKNWGCYKGTFAQANGAGGAQKYLQAAGVTAAPAVLAVDPTNGDLVDRLLGPANYLELMKFTEMVDTGWSLRACDKKVNDKATNEGLNAQDREVLPLRHADALLRSGDTKGAAASYTLAKDSKRQEISHAAEVGLAFCDFADEKWQDAIDKAEKAYQAIPAQMMKDFIELRADCLYIKAMGYFNLKDLDESSKAAEQLRREFIRTTRGWKMEDISKDMGWDFVKKEKIDTTPE